MALFSNLTRRVRRFLSDKNTVTAEPAAATYSKGEETQRLRRTAERFGSPESPKCLHSHAAALAAAAHRFEQQTDDDGEIAPVAV